MERSGGSNENRLVHANAEPVAEPEHMAVLGRASAESASPVHSEAKPGRPTGPVKASNVLRLLEWQQYRCALTGRVLTPETASLDHIIPVRSGGEHRIENTQILHRDVNRAKTTMTNDEFIQLCREIVAYTSV